MFFSMDPIPLNQNNAFCEGFCFCFFLSPFIAKAFRLRSQLLLSSLSVPPGMWGQMSLGPTAQLTCTEQPSDHTATLTLRESVPVCFVSVPLCFTPWVFFSVSSHLSRHGPQWSWDMLKKAFSTAKHLQTHARKFYLCECSGGGEQNRAKMGI